MPPDNVLILLAKNRVTMLLFIHFCPLYNINVVITATAQSMFGSFPVSGALSLFRHRKITGAIIHGFLCVFTPRNLTSMFPCLNIVFKLQQKASKKLLNSERMVGYS